MGIFTLGLENADPELVDFCWGSNDTAARVHVPEKMIRDALSRHDAKNVNIISDMRAFSDTTAAFGSLTRHLGMHPDTMERMAHMRHFPTWLRGLSMDVKREVDKARKGRNDEISVALYCRQGKHRSVAAATF